MGLQQDSETIYNFLKFGIDTINKMIHSFLPDEAVIYLVLILSFLISYIVKHKNRWDFGNFLLFALILFGGLRYVGIG